MKKKLSLLMVALVAIAAFAVQVNRRAYSGETIKTVDGTTTTWDLTAITADMGSTLSTLWTWTDKDKSYVTNGQTAEMTDFAPGLTFIDTNSSGGKCSIYIADENPGKGFYFGGNAAAIEVKVSAGQTLIVTTTGGGGVKSLTENVSFTITGTGPYVSTATIPEGVSYVKFARNAGSATYCTTIVTKTETKAPANLKVTSEAALVLSVGETSEISYTTDSNADVTFESSAPGVATVSSAGVIEAVASGASVITVSQAETDDYQAGVAQVSVAIPYAHTAAAEYTIGNATYGFSDANNYYYFTNGFTMSNTGNKTYGSGSLVGSMKCSANTAYTINIPEGVTITSATVTGRSNYGSDKNAAYWGTLFGEDLTSEALPYSNEDPATKTINFAEGATGTLTFTPTGNQVQLIITLTAGAAPEPLGTTWEKATSIAVGDIVVLAAEGAGYSKELKELSDNIGKVEDYTDIPAGLFPLTVEAGNTEGTFAFKTTTNKYLAANSSNQLPTADEINDNSSWNVTWNGGVLTINNVGQSSRNLKYNSGSPRFACYTSAQTEVMLWKKVPLVPTAVEKPTFSPEPGTYTDDQTVTIACETEGATIYYALGEGEFLECTGPLAITETTTIKAYAQNGEDKSATVTATYTINKPVVAATIAELNALKNNDTFTFGSEVTVVAKMAKALKNDVTAQYVYIKDETGSSLIYDGNSSKTANIEIGAKIAAPWSGKVSIYNSLFELVPDEALNVTAEEPIAVVYPEKDAAYITAEHVNEVVTLKNLTINAVEGNNITFYEGDTPVTGFNQFAITLPENYAGKTYDVVGAISRYNDNIQFQPISISQYYNVNIAAEIANGSVVAEPTTAKSGTEITLTATPDAGYKLLSYSVTGVTSNEAVEVKGGKFTMPDDDVTVSATFVIPEDIAIAPESGADIYEALVAATSGAGKIAKNITINLAENGEYTLKSTIKGPANITINGNGSTIDASTGDNIIGIDGVTEFAKKADETESTYSLVNAITFKDVTIKGMQKALVRDLMSNKTLLETLTIENCVMQVSNAKPFIDFDSRGYVGKVVVKNSTIWAAEGTDKNFAKYGTRPKDINGELTQEFDIQNSTIVNIGSKADFSGGQNFNNFSQKGTAQNVYTVKNNIFVNCGKSGQAIIGLNSGQASGTPVWDVDGNAFNWNGADVYETEVSKAGQKDGADIVKNSVAGVIAFNDAANGDFTQATAKVGDPRWIAIYDITKTAATNGSYTVKAGDADITEAAEGTEVTITATPDENYELDQIKVEGTSTDLEVIVNVEGNVGTFTMPAADVTVIVTFKIATGINSIAADKLKDATIYTIGGQRVNSVKRGLYIINGKKVVIK